MLRRISLVFLPLAFLAAACIGGGSESATDARATPEPISPPPTSVIATYTPEPASPPPASISDTDTVEPGGAANALL